MSAFALVLVLAAAVIHAVWNYLLKRSGGGMLIVWSFATLSAVIYAPLAAAVVWWQRPLLGWEALALMLASAVIHTAYYLLLDRGYRTVSYVAPAREISMLVAASLGASLLAERDAKRRLLAAGAMVIGIVCLAIG